MESIEYETIKLYNHIATVIANSAKSKYNNMNHHSGQNSCLLYLDGKDGIEQNELSNYLGIRTASLSELLAKLEKKGYITRIQSSKNKRTFLVSITPEGHLEAEKSKALILEDGLKMLETLSDEDKQTFYRILKTINNNYLEMEEN